MKYIESYEFDKVDIELPKPILNENLNEYVFVFPEYNVIIFFAEENNIRPLLRIETIDPSEINLEMYSEYKCMVESDHPPTREEITKYWSIGWTVGTQFLKSELPRYPVFFI